MAVAAQSAAGGHAPVQPEIPLLGTGLTHLLRDAVRLQPALCSRSVSFPKASMMSAENDPLGPLPPGWGKLGLHACVCVCVCVCVCD